MEFWPENQGQSALYSKFGTVPGRNCTHNYHDRHQAAHYPLYYGEQQDQGRESSYWTLPGSRTGAAPQEYANWTDQDLTAPASSHFPFILDRHPQQHQDLGGYQTHDPRDREWTASQRATREYERGFVRDGWQRRWEPCSPVRYNREVSTKRNDNSYRELEAWAARYSHSLPRRRRIEAELRGASQGLLESSRAPERESRSGTDPPVAALQQALQSANIRESGLWDRGGRQQAPNYYPSQTPAPDTSHMLDMKEKTGYQRRMFSQPPGYIAPPPYNSPHKSSPVLHHYDTSWEQEGKRQAYLSQPTLRKQDVSVDPRKGEKEDFTKTVASQYTFPELEGLMHRRQETDTSEARSPISVQETHIQHEAILSLQQPQVLQAVQNTKVSEEPPSKVIEGRKFRLNKKTGGMTIFCLVSRIAGTTDTPSLPLCTSQTNIQNTEFGEIPKGLSYSEDIDQTHKLADEVDFRVSTVTEQANTSDARNAKPQQEDTPISVESEMLEVNLSNKAEIGVVSPEKASTNDADSTCGRQAQSVQPVSVKYPLWREPSFTSRAETESSSTCLKAKTEEGESGVLDNQEDSGEVHPIDIEVRRLDTKNETESEDSKDLLVIDTTCVVVKMELIPSPKKEHVHYVDSTPQTEHSPHDIQSTDSPECVQLTGQLNQEKATDQNEETKSLQIDESPESEIDSDLKDTHALDGELSFPFMSSISEKETLEERAERILGIPLHDCITELQPLDLCVEDQEAEHSPVKDIDIDDAVEQIPEDTTEEEQSQNQLEASQTEDAMYLPRNDDAKNQEANEGSEDLAGPQEQPSTISEENSIDLQLQTSIKASAENEITEDCLLKSSDGKGTAEQNKEENQTDEIDTSSQHPSLCLSPPTGLSSSTLLSPSQDSETPNIAVPLMLSSPCLTSLSYISESIIEESHDPELTTLSSTENQARSPGTSSLSHTSSHQLPSPLPPGSDDFSPSSTHHTDHLPSPSPLRVHTGEAVSGNEDQDEEGETSQLINNEISDTLEDLANDMTEELVSLQQFESSQPDNAAFEKESNVTDEQQIKQVDEDDEDHIMKQALKISREHATEVNILQQHHESYVTEEQQPKEVNKDPTGIVEQIISQENVTDGQSQQQLECVQAEDIICAKETYMTDEQLPEEVSEGPTESQSQTEVNILQQPFDNTHEEYVSYLNKTYITEEQSQKEANEDPALSPEYESPGQTKVNILQQQLECVQAEDVVCVKESYMTEEQQSKEASEEPAVHIVKQTHQMSREDATEVNILQQHLETYMTEEQLPEEVSEDSASPLEETISTDNQMEVYILQQPFDNSREEDASYLNKTYITEEQSQKESNEDPTGLLEPTIFQENAADSQTQINILQDTEPQNEPFISSTHLNSNCEVSQSPLDVFSPSKLPTSPHVSHRSDTEVVSLLGMDSALNPDAAASHLDSCKEIIQFSSSDSPSVLLPSSSTHLSLEPQYPKSLWDAVNRIRKHTAPDSENEEEEVSEVWDPESMGEDMGCPGVVGDMNSEKVVFDESRQEEVSTEGSFDDVAVGQTQQGSCHEEPSAHAEEDTLSCCSNSSHGSGDTVIIADEDEVEETPPDVGIESKTQNDEMFQMAEGERYCSSEVKDEAAVKEEEGDGDENVTNECSQSEGRPVMVAKTTTKSVEMTETEQREDKEEVCMPSELIASCEEMTESESVKYMDEQETL